MKSKKSALLLSFTSLLICFAMLVGSTFAWFTDTATTGVNKIVAGNLDVELLMYKEANGEPDYVNISKETAPIFGSENSTVAQNNNLDTLWEPSKTQVAYLAIKNEGNLDLKYQVALNVTNPADGKDLYKVMQYAIVPDAKGTDPVLPAWRTGNSVTPGAQTVSGTNTTDANPAGVKLLHGETHYFALLVHMDENAGNAYQNGKVEFDLTVYATQLNSENDSFGPDYDKDAQYPTSIQELKKKYSADATIVPDGFVVTKYNNRDFDSSNGKTGTITIKDAESLLYFAYVLDPAAALAKEPSTVWPYTSVWYGGSYARHIVLDADIDLQGITLPNGFGNMKNYDFDGQGHTIKNAIINYTGTDNTALFAGGNRGISNLVVENIKVVAPNGTENAVGIVSSDANATIDNVTVRNSSVVGGKYTGAVVGYNYGSVTNCIVENCTVSGRYKVGGIVGYICNSNDNQTFVTGNTLTNVTVKGDNRIAGKSDFVIGKIVGNWNATVGTCKGNTFSGTTVATNNIGKVEARCTDGLTQD